ncbi:MAG: FHA domain-containing protein [Deltaproteobacteria bacterium]|jgi:pSer/pThr/pTyr-binding forkhead associated (FHA) protein|nr:FHA domain-containing protein [Deltaproteobacteria bacterium]
MPVLTLKFKDTKINDYRLQEGGNLTIGRRDANNIVIENLAVSGFHAKIDSIDKGYLLTDLKSKNGTFVNGQLVASHWLGHGDTINIGKHTLLFIFEDGEERSSASGSMDKTMVMDTDKYRDMLSKSSSNAAGQLRQSESNGVLSFLSGDLKEYEIKKKLVKIGKDNSSDIIVGGLMTGKTAATISKRPKGYYLSYVGGMAKPKVNNEVVRESVLLKEFDTIEIGSLKAQFVFKS